MRDTESIKRSVLEARYCETRAKRDKLAEQFVELGRQVRELEDAVVRLGGELLITYNVQPGELFEKWEAQR